MNSVIVNDFSLDSQFSNIDDFTESLIETTIPMLNKFIKLRIQILSSHNVYTLNICNDATLYDILKIKGIPVITKFKKQLSELFFEDPFWEQDSKCDLDSVYECEFTSEYNNYCLAEAFERDIPVFSFEHDEFKSSTIEMWKDDNSIIIKNIYNSEILLEIFRESKVINSFEYILFKYKLEDSFGLTLGKNLFNELLVNAALNEEEVHTIINDIERLIVFTKSGTNPGRLSKTLDGKLKEFRTTIYNSREIRIFYFEKGRNIVFLNGFLKKTQQTPREEIDKAINLMKKLM